MGQEIEHTVRIAIETYGTCPTKTEAAQAAWKTCRQFFGQIFNEDWKQLGFNRAPLPKDEFGEQRPL